MMKKKLIILLCFCAALAAFSSYGREDAAKAPNETWITPSESIDLSNMDIYWQRDNIQFPADDNAQLSIYVNAQKDENGEFAFDDGQEWLLLMKTSLGNYPLFARRYVQLGGISCAAFNEYKDDAVITHVVVTVQQTAGYQIYECVYDDERKAFKVTPVYNAEGINFIADSRNN